MFCLHLYILVLVFLCSGQRVYLSIRLGLAWGTWSQNMAPVTSHCPLSSDFTPPHKSGTQNQECSEEARPHKSVREHYA